MTKEAKLRYFGLMKTVKLQLPSALLEAANFQSGDLSQETARLLALELYREDKVSLGRAAELCQTPLANFMDFVATHRVPPLRYTLEDLDDERHSGSLLEK
jgi:predicted HTH domain antitoxin